MEDNVNQTSNDKIDLILQEMRNFSKRLEEKSNKSRNNSKKLEIDDEKEHIEFQASLAILSNEFEAITKRIDKKIDSLNKQIIENYKRFDSKIDESHKQIFEHLDQLDAKIEKLDSDNKDEHNKIFEHLDHLDARIEKLDSDNKNEHKNILANIDRLDRRITSLKSDNYDEHTRLTKYLDSINSSFIRYEIDGLDKLKVLFDSDVDRKHHQDIYGHEFKRLNDLVAKNSFRISNLENQKQ